MLGLIEAVRRNHALEHGTVSVLLARLGPSLRLAGRAAPDGFFIIGNVAEEPLREAATEALARMRGGEADLAVTPLCGTNIAVAALLASLATFVSLGRPASARRLPNAVAASMIALVLAQPVGRLVQKYLTTSPRVEGLELEGIRARRVRGLNVYRVRTRWRSSGAAEGA